VQLLAWSQDERLWPSDVFLYCSKEYSRNHLADAPEWIKNVFLVLQLQGEVGNGGFNQYIYNTHGLLLDDLIVACEETGLSSLVPLVLQGADAWLECLDSESFKNHIDGTVKGFFNTNQSLDLSDLDHQFYLQDCIIDQQILEYVKSNKDKPPDIALSE
jgi:hypothetical protein